ncbi:MAG: hypothetical protein AAF598_09735 [Bacteroidota bacterium]
MKNLICTCTFAFLFAFTGFSQGLSLEAALGFGLPTSARYRTAATTTTNSGTTIITNEINRLSFGPGLRGGIGLLYQLKSGFGFGLEGHWFQSVTARVDELTVPEGQRFSDFSSTSWRLFPHIYFQLPTSSKIEPFARMGLVLGFNTIKEEVFSDILGSVLNISITYQGGMSIGYQLKMGAIYQLNDRVGLFSEVFLLAMVWSGEERVVNSADENGVNLLPGLTADQINTPITDMVVVDINQPFDPVFPDQLLRQAFHYTTFGLSVGVRYSFGGIAQD